jgi:hypothetical protein
MALTSAETPRDKDNGVKNDKLINSIKSLLAKLDAPDEDEDETAMTI